MRLTYNQTDWRNTNSAPPFGGGPDVDLFSWSPEGIITEIFSNGPSYLLYSEPAPLARTISARVQVTGDIISSGPHAAWGLALLADENGDGISYAFDTDLGCMALIIFGERHPISSDANFGGSVRLKARFDPDTNSASVKFWPADQSEPRDWDATISPIFSPEQNQDDYRFFGVYGDADPGNFQATMFDYSISTQQGNAQIGNAVNDIGGAAPLSQIGV
jgi:hypothetical protein